MLIDAALRRGVGGVCQGEIGRPQVDHRHAQAVALPGNHTRADGRRGDVQRAGERGSIELEPPGLRHEGSGGLQRRVAELRGRTPDVRLPGDVAEGEALPAVGVHILGKQPGEPSQPRVGVPDERSEVLDGAKPLCVRRARKGYGDERAIQGVELVKVRGAFVQVPPDDGGVRRRVQRAVRGRRGERRIERDRPDGAGPAAVIAGAIEKAQHDPIVIGPVHVYGLIDVDFCHGEEPGQRGAEAV